MVVLFSFSDRGEGWTINEWSYALILFVMMLKRIQGSLTHGLRPSSNGRYLAHDFPDTPVANVPGEDVWRLWHKLREEVEHHQKRVHNDASIYTGAAGMPLALYE